MVEAMQEVGSRPKFSVLKGEGHDIHHVYSEQNVYEWLLAQHKNFYDRLVSMNVNFWSPKTDSVISKKREEIINEVKQSNLGGKFILNTQTPTEQTKSFFFNFFKPKPVYEQSTLK